MAPIGYTPCKQENEWMVLLKRHLSALILTAAIIFAAVVYACSNRYHFINVGDIVFDRWTGKLFHENTH